MYIGRIVMVAKTKDGRICVGYRVSSRSFPNRTASVHPDRVQIVPRSGHEADVLKNPYITYNCLKFARENSVAVASNGSHTDPIAEKIDSGMGIRDAVSYSLLALDYEKDQYNTPRICAVIDRSDESAGWLGIVRDNGLEVRRVFLEPGHFWYVATYEEVHICEQPRGEFPATNADDACSFMFSGGIFAERTHPVTAVAAISADKGFTCAVRDAT